MSLATIQIYIQYRRYFHLGCSLASLGVIFFLGFVMLDNHKNYHNFTTCKSNLKYMGVMLDAYSSDHGQYPDSLALLTPGYVKELPACPAAGRQTYHYNASKSREDYTVFCEGTWHGSETGSADFPRYSSQTGLCGTSEAFEKNSLSLVKKSAPGKIDPLTVQCEKHLEEIKRALNKYAEKHGGHFPPSLNELVPAYIEFLPDCPAAGVITYAYKKSSSPERFTIWCEGPYHRQSLGKKNYPQYDSVNGLLR
jgi:hypothetical protein